MPLKRIENSNFYRTSLLLLLFSIFVPFVVYAQKEAAVWLVGAGYQFNFKSGIFEISGFTGNSNAKSSICDKEGNLVFYTDGRTLWNRFNEVVTNGEDLILSSAYWANPPLFLPYPNKEGWYIMFYEENLNSSPWDIGNTLYYATLNANGGRGEVVSKKNKVHDNYHSRPTIAGYCNNSYFWLAIDRNDNVTMNINRDRIFLYKIDENGVSLTPKINEVLDIGNSGGYTFSPNGTKLFFTYQENSNSNIYHKIVDFDFTKGTLYNFRNVGFTKTRIHAFSPDSRFFYFFSGNNIIQVDVRFSTSEQIQNSADTIYSFVSSAGIKLNTIEMQTAPDGCIYFTYQENNENKIKLARIKNPNLKGNACKVEMNLFTINGGNMILPPFVTSFLKDVFPVNREEKMADAGPSFELCSRSSAQIGTTGYSDIKYQWIPESSLLDPFSAITTINTPLRYDSPLVLTYALRATDENCWVNFDSVKVTVLPIPKTLPIEGSRSVCPFVEKVDYWTTDDKNALHWLVDGGEIVSAAANDSIKINWWGSNPKASVGVFSTNKFLCHSDTAILPVRINVELITEIPKGPEKLCIAQSKNIAYHIQNTNGSVYNWVVNDGEIVSGQGTNRLVVNWKKAGRHHIAVEETSLTIDTICFGESNPLAVEIVNDSLDINLSQVSFGKDNNLLINYISPNLAYSVHSLFLLVKNEKDNLTQELRIPVQSNGEYGYTPDISNLSPEIIQLKVINTCDEVFYSNMQQSIILEGNEIPSQEMIGLQWNKNKYWENNWLKHEIWHSTNGLDGWKLISTSETSTDYNYSLQDLSLTHYFRVKEINMDKSTESWSNTIKIEIDDKIIIPDVFTPNGDGVNDIWHIKNITFHKAKRVIVYNKFGQVVFESTNEYTPWDGKINGEIIQGTYFYQITFDSENIRYGQITVLQ